MAAHKEIYPLIPDEAFLYFPSATDIKTKQKRLIFQGGLPLDSYQQDMLSSFQAFLTKKNVTLDPFWCSDRRLRFLQATSYAFDKTLKAMNDHLAWREKYCPPTLSPKVQGYLEKGVLYMCGRDSCYRPILVIDVKKMVDFKIDQNCLIDLLSFFFQYIIEQALIEGQVETWVAIIDIGQVGLFNAAGALRLSITFLANTFRCRMHASYLVQCPSSMKLVWSGIKNFLEEDTLKKIHFTESKSHQALFSSVNSSQVEKRFGGSLNNLLVFWPLKINSYDFEVDDSRQKLISQVDYKLRYENGELGSRKVDMRLIRHKGEDLEGESAGQRGRREAIVENLHKIPPWFSVTPILKSLQNQ